MDLNDRPRQSSEVAVRTIGGECFVVEPGTSTIHSFNAVGAMIWQHLDGLHTVASVVEHVTAEFDVDIDTARDDVLGFLEELLQKQLLDPD